MTKRQFYRNLALRLDAGKPASLNEDDRSVEVLAATESRVQVWDYDRWELVDEVLLMSGLQMPESRQVPLLDTHSRYSSYTVIGSYRDMRVGPEGLLGRSHFSSAPEAEGPYTKVREGHLTDFSVGYRVGEAVWIDEGTSAVIDGRTFEGPVRVVTSWRIKELSVCPIGADELAKARADEALPIKKENLMDKRLRAFLERQGLPKDASEAEAYAFMERMDTQNQAGGQRSEPPPPANPQPAAQPVDPAAAARKAVEEERTRTSEITAMCSRFGVDHLTAGLIKDGTSVDKAREKVMDEMARTDHAGGHGYRAPAALGVDERDKFRAASQDALLLRAGRSPEKPAPGYDELAGRSLVELCRMSLVRAGLSDAGRPIEVVGRALLSSDMPVILGATANLSLMSGFDSASETWPIWCASGSVSNFLTHKAARAGETADLDEIPASGEYEYGDRAETFESYAIATYGKIFAISRQAIIHDDIGALTDTPFQHGESAARKIGDIVYAVLTANSAMGDGVALFHSSHGNLGTSAVVSETSIGEGIKKMGLQKDVSGKRRLNISPNFFIAPKALEGAGEIFFSSDRFTSDAKDSTRNNIYSGNRFTRAYDARLDDASSTAWYLAGPKGKTIKVFFLDGVQKPYLEHKSGWTVDGVEHKVRIDAGAKAMEWRTLLKNAGA